MNDPILSEDAIEMECLLSSLLQRLFYSAGDHPTQKLTIAQLRVCVVLENGGQTISVLAGKLHRSVASLSQIADRLERIGLVERVAQPGDRRGKLLLLTEHGIAVMRSRREQRVHRVNEVLCLLEREKRTEILAMFHTLLEAVSLSTVAKHSLPYHEPAEHPQDAFSDSTQTPTYREALITPSPELLPGNEI